MLHIIKSYHIEQSKEKLVIVIYQFHTSVNEGSNERGHAQLRVAEERRAGVFFPVTDE